MVLREKSAARTDEARKAGKRRVLMVKRIVFVGFMMTAGVCTGYNGVVKIEKYGFLIGVD